MIFAFQDRELALQDPRESVWAGRLHAEAGVASAELGAARGISLPARKFLGELARTALQPSAIALVLVGASLASTLLLRSLFPYPFLFLFFAAVMASAWIGGTASGLLAVLLSTLAVDYYFVTPFNSFAINPTDGTYFVAFVACAVVASWVSSSKKKSEEALVAARDQLEMRVAERTAELRQSNAELRNILKEHKKAQEALGNTQAELAHLSRVTAMGELTSSIAHEVNQPLTAVVTYGHACLEWLSADPPNLDEARMAAHGIIRDGTRAGAVIGRIRSLFKKEAPAIDWLCMNDVIRELTVLLRDEALRHRVSLKTELAPGLPRVRGDRVQLQQVVLNLVMNGMDAMKAVTGVPREILIRTGRENPTGVGITVEDCGIGLTPETAERIFQPFFSTKPQGIGMGLSISRSIIESHAGRLWASPRPAGGAVFHFTIPAGS